MPPAIRPITLIISPLVAIEQDQAEELKNRFGAYSSPVVLDGTNNTAELRAEIARGNYTHVWASAEVVLADLADCNKKKPRTVRRSYVKRFDSGYIDHGSVQSVAQDEVFRRRLQLLAIDELHLVHLLGEWLWAKLQNSATNSSLIHACLELRLLSLRRTYTPTPVYAPADD